jgi:hypothetical protein
MGDEEYNLMVKMFIFQINFIGSIPITLILFSLSSPSLPPVGWRRVI